MDENISFCLLGSKSTGKTSILNKYISSSGINKADTIFDREKNRITFDKPINNITFKIKVLELSEPAKYYDYIKNTDFIFLIFDFAERKTFESIIDVWKGYLIDKVEYANKLYLLGNQFKNEEFLTTRIEEVQDLIKEINQEKGVNIEFFDIGNMSNDKLIEFIDDKILIVYEEKKKSKPNKSDPSSGSCFIF